MNTLGDGIVCETSTAADGNMDFRFGDAETVIQNRTNFLLKYGIAYEDHIAMRCDHGDIISIVTSFHPEVGAHAQEDQIHSEVLVTQEKGLALMLFTADCQPTSFYDPVTQTIALAHISRTTLTEELPQKTIIFLQESLGVDPADLLVNIGPSILKESYAFPLPLEEEHPLLAPYIENTNGFAHIDLVQPHVALLASLGIEQKNIRVSGKDTGALGEYFSYYMMKKEGRQQEARMATILMMR